MCTYQFPGWQRCPGPPLSSWQWWPKSYVLADCAECALLGCWTAGDSTWRSGRAECCHSQGARLGVECVKSSQNSFLGRLRNRETVVTFYNVMFVLYPWTMVAWCLIHLLFCCFILRLNTLITKGAVRLLDSSHEVFKKYGCVKWQLTRNKTLL